MFQLFNVNRKTKAMNMNNNKFWIITGGLSGLLGVALGALGAHGLKSILSSEMLEVYKTGVLYQLIHSITILAVGLSGMKQFGKAGLFFMIGIILFSLSLYVYSMTELKFFAMITPVGGISFLIGWLLLIIEGIKLKKTEQ